MGFFGFLGAGLRKFGEIGSQAIQKVGSLGVHAYRAVNALSGGAIGNAIESLPVVGGIAKQAGQLLSNPEFINKVSDGFRAIGKVGSGLEEG